MLCIQPALLLYNLDRVLDMLQEFLKVGCVHKASGYVQFFVDGIWNVRETCCSTF